MRQEKKDICARLDDSRVRDENAAQKLDMDLRRKKAEIRIADTRLKDLRGRLRSAEAGAMLLAPATGALGGLAGRVVLGTIAEGLASVAGAIGVERIKGDVKEAEAGYEKLFVKQGSLENLLHNAQANAKRTIEQMRAAGCPLPRGR